MDALDNLIYVTLRRPLNTGPIVSDYVGSPAGYGLIATPPFYFSNDDKMNFVCWHDVNVIERAFNQHWYDISRNPMINYYWVFGGVATTITDFTLGSPYHMVTAYLAENTRIVQIFHRLIDSYLHDEDLGIATSNQQVIQWIINTEQLFFKGCNIYNPQSGLRPGMEATRRNVYYRLLGLELAFGEEPAGSSTFRKAKASNKEFIVLFEQYLAEIWQAYINIRNQVGPNSTDNINLSDLARQLRELLNARRGFPFRGREPYINQNLAYEEYFSVFMLTWFTFALSYNDSPIVQFFKCESNSIGERLAKLGATVGLPAHQKSQSLFDLADAGGAVLRAIELGILENPIWITNMFSNPPVAETVPLLNDLLTVINNWEKATGHKIKNREANVNGTFRIAQMARGSLVTN